MGTQDLQLYIRRYTPSSILYIGILRNDAGYSADKMSLENIVIPIQDNILEHTAHNRKMGVPCNIPEHFLAKLWSPRKALNVITDIYKIESHNNIIYRN